MAYQALYRVWRPQTFGALVGQDHVARTLKNACINDRIAHAYLFCGPRGTGKTSTARLLAKAVNCRQPDKGEPCNQCPNCLAVNDGSSVDVIEIDAASNRGIEEIKSLRERVKFSAANSRYRVYIIDEVHMLSHDAFNAFLKTLEEPPAHVIFILATTEAHKVPLTILSRCQRFDFRRIEAAQISGRLAEIAAAAGLEADGEALDIIARAAEGGLRDAISVLDQAAATGEGRVTVAAVHSLLGTVAGQIVETAAEHLLAGRTAPLLQLVGDLEQWGKDPRFFLRDLAGHLRRLLLTEAGGDGPVPRLWYVLRLLTEAEPALKGASQPGLVLELALIRASHPEWGFLPEDLSRRLENVEQRLAAAGGAVAPLPGKAPPKPVPAIKREETAAAEEEPARPRATPEKPPVAENRGPQAGGTHPEPGSPARRQTGWGGEGGSWRIGAQEEAAPEPVRAPEKPAPVVEEKPVAPADGGTLARVRQAWPAIREKVKVENPFLFNAVSRATPVQVDGDRLILGFGKSDGFFRDLIERDGGAGLASLLAGVCPGIGRIGSVLAGEAEPPKKKGTAEETGFIVEKLFDARPVGDEPDARGTGGRKRGGAS